MNGDLSEVLWFCFKSGVIVCVFVFLVMCIMPRKDILEDQSWKFKSELYDGHQYIIFDDRAITHSPTCTNNIHQ